MKTKFHLRPVYYLGENCVGENLANEIKSRKYKNILLWYGGGSIKKNGCYDQIIKGCKEAGANVIEYAGVKPNPLCTHIDEGAEFCKNKNIDLIIAAGGGSVVDSAKVLAVMITNKHIKQSWDYILDWKLAKEDATPIFSIITIPGTASENNNGSVISNEVGPAKLDVMNDSATPLVCFEDPTYTLTLSKWQAASGIFDSLSHCLEQYYDLAPKFDWTHEFLIFQMKQIIKHGYKVMKHPEDINHRKNALWNASMALNGIPTAFSTEGDWCVHALEHSLSAEYDVTHGAGLALLTPVYIRHMCDINETYKELTQELSKKLFDKKGCKAFIKELNKFIKALELPTKYSDFEEIKDIDSKIPFLVKHTMLATGTNPFFTAEMAEWIFKHISK